MRAPLTEKEIDELVELARGGAGGADYPGSRKRRFRLLGRKVLLQLVKDLGLLDGTWEIRFNPGGNAVTGESTLHGEDIYVHIGWQISEHQGLNGIYFRYCKGRKDYTGGPNQWYRIRDLGNWEDFVGRVQATRRVGKAVPA